MPDTNCAWATLEESAAIVASMRLDIAMMIEADLVPPPVLFRSFQHLQEWATNHGLQISKIEGTRLTSAVRIHGQYKSSIQTSTFECDQVWVRATYTAYNRAMKSIALKGFDVDKAAFEGTHADHVINRGRLQLIPDAWGLLFPVSQLSNSPFGAIEGKLELVGKDVERIDLPPLVALKLFCGRLPKSEDDLKHAMKDVRGNFLKSIPEVLNYCDRIESEARLYIE